MSGSPIPDLRERLTYQLRAPNASSSVAEEAVSALGAAVAAAVLPTAPAVVALGGGGAGVGAAAADLDRAAAGLASNALNLSIVGPGLSGTNLPTPDDINSFYFYQTEQFTVLWILFAMIVLGNTAVLVTLALNKSRKSRMNFFIKHLAIADLAVGLINVLTDIVWRITVTWYAGNAACKFIRFMQATVTFASTYVLVALSIDRYDAITHPMNFSGSWRRARILVLIAWMMSIVFSLPMMFLFEEKPIEGQLQCWIDLKPWQWKVYMTIIAMILFVVPAVVISACYTIIVRTIWSKSKLLLVPPATIGLVQPHTRINGADDRILRPQHHHHEDLHDCRRASSRGIIPKAKIKTVKMTFVIVFVFVLCWSPYIVFDLLQVYDYIPRTQTNIAVATFIQSLAPLNSAANPVIYCLFSTHMCRTLRKLPPFKWLSCCLSACVPTLEAAGSGPPCLGYMRGRSRDSTRTNNTSLTTLSSTTRRSGSAASLRQHTIRLQAAATGLAPPRPANSLAAALNRQHKVAISVV